MNGYPTVSVLDRSGRVLPLTYHLGGDQMITPDPPSRVDVQPGGHAVFGINKFRCDEGDKGEAAQVTVTPPGEQTPFSLVLPAGHMSFSYCATPASADIVSVSPVEPDYAAIYPRHGR